MFMMKPSRRLLCMLLCLTLMLSTLIIPGASLADSTGTTNAKVVLRESARKDSEALQTIPKGEEVTITNTSGSWYRVRYGNFSGYVMKQYVDKASASASSAKKNRSARQRPRHHARR